MTEKNELKTLLLIEDNPDDYEATRRSFQKANFLNPIHWSPSANDGIDFLKGRGRYESDPPRERPGLILLDLNMPGIDGRAALSIIKNDEEIRSIPVIVLTTSADERDVEYCYSIGASTYIQKPVDLNRLVEAAARMRDYWFGVALLPCAVTK